MVIFFYVWPSIYIIRVHPLILLMLNWLLVFFLIFFCCCWNVSLGLLPNDCLYQWIQSQFCWLYHAQKYELAKIRKSSNARKPSHLIKSINNFWNKFPVQFWRSIIEHIVRVSVFQISTIRGIIFLKMEFYLVLSINAYFNSNIKHRSRYKFKYIDDT